MTVIDLHTHSNASDGTDSPAALVKAAAAAGVTTLGITDHDTTAGWQEAARQAALSGIALVRGAEISTNLLQGDTGAVTQAGAGADASFANAGAGVRSDADGLIHIHLLSYLHDPTHPALRDLFDQTRAQRLDRLKQMTARLSADFPITWADVQARTGQGATVGRPHIADALIAAGVVPNRDVAFAKMLRAGAPYYLPYVAPSTVEVIGAVRAAGGVPVIAHPFAYERGRCISPAQLRMLARAGLMGVEVDHRDQSPQAREELRCIAGDLGLIVTGSSDYHGAGKPNRLGENTTSAHMLVRIAEAGAIGIVGPVAF